MRIIILTLLLVSVFCGQNMRHRKSNVGEVHDLSNEVGVISKTEVEVSPPITKQQYQINKAAKKTTYAIEQALEHSTTTTSFVEMYQDDVIDNIPFLEETIDQMSSVKPETVYSNDGNSPDMGTSAEVFETQEAPLTNEDNQITPQEEYYAPEMIISNEQTQETSLIQLQEIDALADVDTSMPLFDEDFKYDEQALQETPLNVGVVDEVQNQEEVQQNVDEQELLRQTDNMVEALANEEDHLINEAQLIQVADRGFY